MPTSKHITNRSDWLQLHFDACRHEYEGMLRSAGFRQAERVLDAGSGSGEFLPVLISEIGDPRCTFAIDLDCESIALVRKRYSVDGLVGSITNLPFAANSFDGLWSANVLQFLRDEELGACLSECKRVVRPGGLIAIKDVDMTGFRFLPADPFLISHLSEVSYKIADTSPETAGSLRGRALKMVLESAGLKSVRQDTRIIERSHPLSQAERAFYAEWLVYLAEIATQRGVSADDLHEWQQILGEDGGRGFVSRPDFYVCEMQVLAVGTAP